MDLLTEFNIPELTLLVANKMHTNKFGELPKSFDSYMILKDKDGRKNIMNIKSNPVPTRNLQTKTEIPRIQSDRLPTVPLSDSDKTATATAGRQNNDTDKRPQPSQHVSEDSLEQISPIILYKYPGKTIIAKDVDKTKIDKKYLTNVKITVPLQPKTNIGAPKGSLSKVKKEPRSPVADITDSDSDVDIESIDSLKKKRLSNTSETKTVSSEMETTDSLNALKRRSPLVRLPGPSLKKQKLATAIDKGALSGKSLRSIRKTVADDV